MSIFEVTVVGTSDDRAVPKSLQRQVRANSHGGAVDTVLEEVYRDGGSYLRPVGPLIWMTDSDRIAVGPVSVGSDDYVAAVVIVRQRG